MTDAFQLKAKGVAVAEKWHTHDDTAIKMSPGGNIKHTRHDLSFLAVAQLSRIKFICLH